MIKKKKRGGKREGSGRKESADKKLPFTIYVPGSWLTKIGRNSAKTLCIGVLDAAAKNV